MRKRLLCLLLLVVLLLSSACGGYNSTQNSNNSNISKAEDSSHESSIQNSEGVSSDKVKLNVTRKEYIDGFIYSGTEDTTPYEAADALVRMLLEDLQKKYEDRSFRITEYECFSFKLTPMKEMPPGPSVNNIQDWEREDNIWFLYISADFKWVGTLDLWGVEGEGLTWHPFLYGMAAETAYRIVREGNTYTLQSRMDIYYDLDEPSDLFHEVDAAIVDTLRNGEITFSPMLYADSPKTIDGFVYTASKDTTPQDAAEYLINLLLEDLQTENPQRSFKITNVFNLVIGAPTALDENTWTIKIAGQFLFTGLIHYISIDESDLHHTHFLYAQYKMVKTGNTYTLYAS